MKRILVLLITVCLLLCMTTSAFATEEQEEISLRVYNWGEYISDGEDDSLDVIELFEETYPYIDVEYTTYATNEELYAKLCSGAASYDVIIPSDYMISRMIDEDMLQKLDFDNIPNYSDIMDVFTAPDYDPTGEYSVPYAWGTVCLIYNTTMVDEEITSWDALWDPTYTNRILMFNNSRDAFGIALIRLGYSLNTTDEDELAEAAASLAEQKNIIQAYVMDEIFDKMISGEAAVAPYYTGDGLIMAEENENLVVVIPEEGTNQFVDAMVIPTVAREKEAAELFINFMCETEVGLANIEYLGYSTPLESVYAELDDEIINDGLSYLDEDFLENYCETYINLPDETNTLLQEMWVDVLASGQASIFELIFLIIVMVAVGIGSMILLRRRKNNQ